MEANLINPNLINQMAEREAAKFATLISSMKERLPAEWGPALDALQELYVFKTEGWVEDQKEIERLRQALAQRGAAVDEVFPDAVSSLGRTLPNL